MISSEMAADRIFPYLRSLVEIETVETEETEESIYKISCKQAK